MPKTPAATSSSSSSSSSSTDRPCAFCDSHRHRQTYILLLLLLFVDTRYTPSQPRSIVDLYTGVCSVFVGSVVTRLTLPTSRRTRPTKPRGFPSFHRRVNNRNGRRWQAATRMMLLHLRFRDFTHTKTLKCTCFYAQKIH